MDSVLNIFPPSMVSISFCISLYSRKKGFTKCQKVSKVWVKLSLNIVVLNTFHLTNGQNVELNDHLICQTVAVVVQTRRTKKTRAYSRRTKRIKELDFFKTERGFTTILVQKFPTFISYRDYTILVLNIQVMNTNFLKM